MSIPGYGRITLAWLMIGVATANLLFGHWFPAELAGFVLVPVGLFLAISAWISTAVGLLESRAESARWGNDYKAMVEQFGGELVILESNEGVRRSTVRKDGNYLLTNNDGKTSWMDLPKGWMIVVGA